MRRLLFMIWAWLCFCEVQSKAVFAHFMVGNVAYYTAGDWLVDIAYAWSLGIDAFALNIAYGDETVNASVATAFEAMNSAPPDFKLFFSFDYAGGPGGPWPAADVASYLAEYTGNTGYYHTDSGKAFVSTFEGPANAQDWVALKSAYNVFFMPDWSSLGAGPAWDLGVADGLFSWAAWPWGNEDSNSYVDASYLQVLKDGGDTGAPYMMGVSPMFYTNLPHYDKNWAWRGDRLWFDRWQEVLFLQPDYVEIITWNDWGESHYIREMDATQAQSVLNLGEAPFDYVTDFEHVGWTKLLPIFTSLYKTGKIDQSYQTLVAWGRSTSVEISCSTNGTTVNTASQLQIEFPPDLALRDNVYYVAVVKEMPPDVAFVTIGGVPIGPDISNHEGNDGWSDVIGSASAGGYILFGNASFSGYSGDLIVGLGLADNTQLQVSGLITDGCTDGFTNYNMWAAYDLQTVFGPMSIEDYVCTAGTSIDDFSKLCEFTCALGYCPYTACICSEIGPQPDLPKPVDTQCYPLASASVVYEGLCHFACTYGFLDTEHCGTDDVSAPIPTVSPFTPHAATAGTGNGQNDAFTDLCAFTCQYGYCPIAACTVTGTGPLVLFTGEVYGGSANFTSEPWNEALDDLCKFSCNRGHCPDACTSNLACTSGSGDGNYAGLCSFSCGYGFCPEPCTCLSHGTSTPPAFDPTIMGYADTGLDADTYGPLCNFTCSHGYCPTPNACLFSITINPDEESTIPTLPAFDNEPVNATYSPGDFFTYVSEENPDFSLDVILLESTDLGNITCDDVVSGDNGATLGCVGEAVEFLMISLFNDQYALSDTKRDVEPRTNYDFATHSLWKASGNCTTRYCMLAEGAPLHTWRFVGNGSYNGVPYELHFINTGSNHGFSARRGLPSSSTSTPDMERRQVLGNKVYAANYYRPLTTKDFVTWDLYGKPIYPDFSQPLIDLTTDAAMESAKQGYTITCNTWKNNDTAILNNSDSIIEGVMDISFPTVGTAVGLSSADVDKYVSSCTTEEESPHGFVIVPVDGLNVDDLSALLASFPNANVVPHVSLNGFGMMYWTANLTPSQWKQVTQNKQCADTESTCDGDCPSSIDDPDPSFIAPAWLIQDSNETAQFKRDSGVISQDRAPADLVFISNGPDAGYPIDGHPYWYDGSAGSNVVAYILDEQLFDFSLPELSLHHGVVQTKIVGPDGWQPGYMPNGKLSHGTAMAAALGGDVAGVAKGAKIVPVAYYPQQTRYWFLDALDWILSDWRGRAASLDPALAPLGVLSMSIGFVVNRQETPDYFWLRMAGWLRSLVSAGILPIAAAGNNAFAATGSPAINILPAVLGDPSRVSTYVPSMLVIGSVNNHGVLSTFSNTAYYSTLFAPGENILFPYWDDNGQQDFGVDSGTSQATAKVAGLAAYFIGLSSNKDRFTNTQAVADYIQSLAYTKVGLKSIFNGVPPDP